MKKYCYILLLCIIHLLANGQKVYEISAKNFPKTFVPGQFYTVFYEVRSQVSDASINGELIAPAGISIITSKKQTTDYANNLRFLYTIFITRDKPADRDSIVFNLVKNQRIIQRFISPIEVIKTRRVEFSTLEVPNLGKEGDTLQLKFLIQNVGNTTEKIRVELPKNDLETLNDSIILPPNKSYELVSRRKIPTSSVNSWVLNADYKIWLKDSLNPLRSYVTIPVYSATLKNNDRYLRLPIEVGAWYNHFMVGRELKQAVQFDIRGSGFLDFANQHYVDFVAHGPNQLNFPGIGSFDQYSLDYKYKEQLSAKLGDYNLQFSQLLEFGRFGRGFYLEQNLDKIGYKAFYMRARFNPYQKNSFGGTFTFKPIKDFAISVNYLFKEARPQNTPIREFINSQFVSVSSHLIKRNIRLLTEIGTNLSGLSKDEVAGMNQLTISYRRFSVNSQLIYAGKHFYGFYNDSWQASNGLNYFINKNVNIGVNSNFIRTNPSLDPVNFNTSPYENRNLVYINFRSKDKHTIQLSYNLVSREDRFEPKMFHFKENFTRLTYTQNTQRLTLTFNGNYGFAHNLLIQNDNSGKNESYGVSFMPEIKVLKWMSIGGYGQYDRNNKFTEAPKNYFFYGGVFRVNASHALNAYFQYRNSYAPDELTQQRSFMDANLNLDLKRHRFSVSGGKVFLPSFSGANQNTMFFIVKYSLKLGIPIARNKKLGSITGDLSSLSNTINKSGVLIKLGNRSFLTDSSGKFFFHNLTPDNYYLTLDKNHLAAGLVTEGNATILVKVKSDSISKVGFKLIKSGGIEGKVKFQNNQQMAGEDLTANKPIILAKLSNEKESFLTQANKNNEFSFKEMKAGNWHLKVWSPGKEQLFSVENAEQSILIEEDKIKQCEFLVKPAERKIYFSSTNFNLVVKKDNEKPNNTIIEQSVSKTFDRLTLSTIKVKNQLKVNNPTIQFSRKLQNTIKWYSDSEPIALKVVETPVEREIAEITTQNEQTETELMRNLQNKEKQRR